MYLSLGELLVLFAFGGASVFFLSAIRVRELALQAVQRASRDGDGSGAGVAERRGSARDR